MNDIAQPVTVEKKQRVAAEPTLIGTLDSGDAILKALISKHHHDLAMLNILLLCTNKEIKQGGRARPGKVQKTTPLVKYLSSLRDKEADIIITVSLPGWNEADGKRREAILDHLLTCIEVTEDEATGAPKVAIVSPQVAEFAEVVERHGAYNDGIQDLANVLRAEKV